MKTFFTTSIKQSHIIIDSPPPALDSLVELVELNEFGDMGETALHLVWRCAAGCGGGAGTAGWPTSFGKGEVGGSPPDSLDL